MESFNVLIFSVLLELCSSVTISDALVDTLPWILSLGKVLHVRFFLCHHFQIHWINTPDTSLLVVRFAQSAKAIYSFDRSCPGTLSTVQETFLFEVDVSRNCIWSWRSDRQKKSLFHASATGRCHGPVFPHEIFFDAPIVASSLSFTCGKVFARCAARFLNHSDDGTTLVWAS